MKNELQFVTLHTKFNGEKRNVSIAYDGNTFKNPWLLGGLTHGTELIIDQALIDGLQELVNAQKEEKAQ